MLARTDEVHPVWGPAKPDDAILRPGYRLGCLIPEDKRRRLAALGLNTVRAVRSAGRTGLQPRTLAAGSAGTVDWQRLAARRLALFIVNSIERGTRWVVLGKPHAEVAELATAQLREFFEWLHAAGAFGARPLEESYFVVCDRRVNPVDDTVANAFQMLIGFASDRRGEFHSFRISHSVAGSSVTAVSLNRLQASLRRA
jgi:phage tail sheath protein FI